MERQGNDQVGNNALAQSGQLLTEVDAKCQTLPILEGLNQFVEREVVAIGGKRRVEVWWTGQTAATDLAVFRRYGASGAARFFQPRQFGRAGFAKDVACIGRGAQQAVLFQHLAQLIP